MGDLSRFFPGLQVPPPTAVPGQPGQPAPPQQHMQMPMAPMGNPPMMFPPSPMMPGAGSAGGAPGVALNQLFPGLSKPTVAQMSQGVGGPTDDRSAAGAKTGAEHGASPASTTRHAIKYSNPNAGARINTDDWNYVEASDDFGATVQAGVLLVSKVKTPISYMSGRLVAVAGPYVCYVLSKGRVRVIHLPTTARCRIDAAYPEDPEQGGTCKILDIDACMSNGELVVAVTLDSGIVDVTRITGPEPGVDNSQPEPHPLLHFRHPLAGGVGRVFQGVSLCANSRKLALIDGIFVITLDVDSFNPKAAVPADMPENHLEAWGGTTTSAHGGQVSCARFSADGSQLVTSCDDGLVRVFESATGEMQTSFEPDGGRPVSSVFVIAGPPGSSTNVLDTPMVTGTDRDSQLQLWGPRGRGQGSSDGEPLQRLSLAVGPDLHEYAEDGDRVHMYNSLALSSPQNVIVCRTVYCTDPDTPEDTAQGHILVLRLDDRASDPSRWRFDWVNSVPVAFPVVSMVVQSPQHDAVDAYCVQTTSVQRYTISLPECFGPYSTPIASADSGVLDQKPASGGGAASPAPASATTVNAGATSAAPAALQRHNGDAVQKAQESTPKAPDLTRVDNTAAALKAAQEAMSIAKQDLHIGIGNDEAHAEAEMDEATDASRQSVLLSPTSLLQQGPGEAKADINQNATSADFTAPLRKETAGTVVDFESMQKSAQQVIVNKLDQSLSGLSTTVAGALKQEMLTAFRDAFERRIIPGFEKACQEMLAQVQNTVNAQLSSVVVPSMDARLDKLASGIRHQQDSIDSLSANIQILANAVKRLATNEAAQRQPGDKSARSGAGEVAANHSQPAAASPRDTVIQHLEGHNYEQAFWAALSAQDVALVDWLCTQVDLHNTIDHLSQVIILTLIQQLSSALGQNTGVKLLWLQACAVALNKNDPQIKAHVPAIMVSVQNTLEANASDFSSPQHPLRGQFSLVRRLFKA